MHVHVNVQCITLITKKYLNQTKACIPAIPFHVNVVSYVTDPKVARGFGEHVTRICFQYYLTK